VKELACLLRPAERCSCLSEKCFGAGSYRYHRVDATADRHFSALHYVPIGLQAYLKATPEKNKAPSTEAVIVTIDDDHESVYRLKPLLAKHQMPVTVFLCSGLAGTNRRFWFSANGLDTKPRQYFNSVPDETRVTALRVMGFDDYFESVKRESQLKEVVDFQVVGCFGQRYWLEGGSVEAQKRQAHWKPTTAPM